MGMVLVITGNISVGIFQSVRHCPRALLAISGNVLALLSQCTRDVVFTINAGGGDGTKDVARMPRFSAYQCKHCDMSAVGNILV